MKRRRAVANVILLTLLSVPAASCVFMAAYSSSSHREYFDVTITFRGLDGSLRPGEPVHVYEIIGDFQQLTEIRQADASGEFRLKGHYCAKVELRAAGAIVELMYGETGTHYDAVINPAKTPQAEPSDNWSDKDRRAFQHSLTQLVCAA